MTVPHDMTYPTNATNKTWQAKKTVGDKMLTKTGLGPKLTEAEAKWKAISWIDLDIAKHKIDSVLEAEAANTKAKAALLQVKTAETALTHAFDEARVTATTKGLSSGTKTAATNAVNALAEAKTRLVSVKIDEFQHKVDAMKAPVKISNISVRDQHNDKLADSGTGEWDRKHLKVTGLKWGVKKADAFTGKTLTVSGKPEKVHDDQGISAVWQNDMLIESISGTTVTFKSAH